MSRRQLHEDERGVAGHAALAVTSTLIRDSATLGSSARSCEMEALDQVQHRAKAKLRKAIRAGVSAPSSVTPHIQSWLCGTGDGCGTKRCALTPMPLSPRTPARTPSRTRFERPPRACTARPSFVARSGNSGE